MKEEKKQTGFQLKGKINYELELFEEEFSFRTQVSNENNLCVLLSAKNILEAILHNQKSSALDKNKKLKPKEFNEVYIAHKTLCRYSEDLAAAVYQIQLKEDQKPKLKVVTTADILKSKGIV